ncbi:DNA topoisomerase III [Desulfuribacillus alkaliarsenatis]|uniref:DNA topoisomerase 3 n=1 Tax=Desulfuribacillus alkaliarsenatis TaxID=766136 RepID=A0A1E5G2X1_9FIRM|nr:DNA topoisomerase III [Desulfuribacillus alkaliarsenatis]OEF97408.1 DNA topoisomerase III [Desulfuribacillus alkaliarsenatis]
MSKIAVLAEKPSVARDIARVLNCNKKGNGYLEGQQYIVTWALGHLVTLADPEVYDEKYKSWQLEHLPMLPSPLKLVVIKQTGKQYKAVRDVITRKDVNEVVIATDAGREGELVARWILEKANVRKPLKRLWISSVTDKAIKEGFQRLRSGKEFENLYASAIARSEADWLVGINATRALTTKYNAQLSCGRVQTPTLAMIVKKEEEIRSFIPKPYYGIVAKTTDGLKLTWNEQKTGETRSFNKDAIDKKLQKLQTAKTSMEVIDVKKAAKKSYAPQLYDLTELQRDANKIFGYSAKETLSIMQKLYENHKYLTYPRTDSRYISIDIVDTLKERLKACAVGDYQKFAAKIQRSAIKASKHFVDNSKVSDHHAIIPTEQTVFLNNLSDKERKIYDLVVKRFLAVLLPAFEYEQTTITAALGGEQFIAKGKIINKLGWKEVYGSYNANSAANDYVDNEDTEQLAQDVSSAKDQTLPDVKKGDNLTIDRIEQTTGETKPPSYFTEATLLSAMENPVKYMDTKDKELLKTIGQTGGLGTVATRADIIEKLFNSFLLEKRGKEIHSTSKGRQLLKLVPEDLRSPELTADWEQKLDAIAKGKLKKDTFVTEMRNYAKKVVNDIKGDDQTFKHDNLSRTKCPDCGKYMLEVQGKKGKMLVCEDRECGHRKSVSKVTNARCPECKKKLELRGQGEGQIFVCKCGYREKMSAFQERRQDKNSKVNKKETAKLIKQINKEEEPINTALADALAKLKLK